MFDQGKTGFIESVKIATILTTLGHTFDEDELNTLIEQHDVDGKKKVHGSHALFKNCSPTLRHILAPTFSATSLLRFNGRFFPFPENLLIPEIRLY